MNRITKPASPIEVGFRVYSIDGRLLGRLGELSAADFRLDSLMGGRSWLMQDCIAGATGGEITLILEANEVASFSMDGPRP